MLLKLFLTINNIETIVKMCLKTPIWIILYQSSYHSLSWNNYYDFIYFFIAFLSLYFISNNGCLIKVTSYIDWEIDKMNANILFSLINVLYLFMYIQSIFIHHKDACHSLFLFVIYDMICKIKAIFKWGLNVKSKFRA